MAIPRKFLFGGGAAIGAFALFGAGALTAAALIDSDDGGSPATPIVYPGNAASSRPSTTSPTGVSYPGQAVDGDDAVAAGRGGGIAYPETAAVADKLYPAYFCPAEIDPSVLGATIDPSQAGFAMSLLGEGYVLQSISLRAEGDCDDQGNSIGSHLVLDTSWRHVETGFDVVVTQRAGGEPVASVLYPESAQFSANGYSYSVFVNSYRYYAEKDVAIQPPQDGPDPRVAEVVIATVRALAPELDQQCFYTQRQGDWGDLPALGIGDPRSAIPSGLTQNWFNLLTLEPPTRDCGGPAPEGAGSQSFNLSYNDDSGGWLGIDVYPVWPGQEQYPGYSDQYSLNWNNGTYQFGVYGNRNGVGLGKDALTAIALALDPQFSSACLVSEQILTEADLPALGFRAPSLPPGFSITDSRFAVSGLPDGCPIPSDYEVFTTYYLNWELRSEDGTTIGISANRTEGAPVEPGTPPGYISPNGIGWTGADGTYYSIWASTIGISPAVDSDLLIEIATSLDPQLDPATLSEEPGAGGYPVKPLTDPAR